MKIRLRVLIAFVVTAVSYYLYIHSFINEYISSSADINMILALIITFFIYLMISLVLDRTISDRDRYAFSFLYMIFLVTLFYSKDIDSAAGYINTFNLDIRSLEYSTNSNVGMLFIIMNVILIIPLGWMFRRLDIVIKLVLPLLIFLVIEYTQYLYGVGVFDINDIILNTIGFYIGAIIFNKLYNIVKK